MITPPSNSGRNILVIDDDEGVRDAFELALDGQDCEVETAEEGEAGLRKFATHRPDMVFLDLRMPGIDGFETLRRLRRMDDTIPVFIVTAYHPEYLDALETLSASSLSFELISKPMSADHIRSVVGRTLGTSTKSP